MRQILEFFWDWSEDGNVAHIAEHAITPEQVEQVVARAFEGREPSRSRPDRWSVRGTTEAGLFIIVVFELEWLDALNCWGVTPVTAFELT